MRRDVFVFVDALGWDLVAHTGFLADLLPHRRAVEMQCNSAKILVRV